MLSTSPRFNAAHRYSRPLAILAGLLAITGGILLVLALRASGTPPFLGYLGAALLCAAGTVHTSMRA